jgi:hypothetical protein
VFDQDARKTLATPGPYIAAAVALVTMAPHLVWLVQNDFLPFAYAEHRALPSRGLIDHVWHPFQFALAQAFFLVPSALIAAPLFFPKQSAKSRGGDVFDRRILSWLAFGPTVTVLAMAALSGRGTVAMWAPLFSRLWFVTRRKKRNDATWRAPPYGRPSSGFRHRIHCQLRDASNHDHRYRAVFFPAQIRGSCQRYRATGCPIIM